LILTNSADIFAQPKSSLKGKVVDKANGQPIPFINVSLLITSDSSFYKGTITDDSGNFVFNQLPDGNITLNISALGYKSFTKSMNTRSDENTDAGQLFLEDTSNMLTETVVVANSIKARSENGKTDYLVTKKMLDVSSSGMDIMRLIPGVQIDLMHNISLEGSRNIQILVDGKERDVNFINQLNPAQIQKIEITNSPQANADGTFTGTINIVLKKEKNSGFNGQMVAEIPTSPEFVYIFPNCNFNYNFKKLNIFASYDGEINRENIDESIFRNLWTSIDTNTLFSDQYVVQKNWSHRFHLGFDFSLTENDEFDFYIYSNPFSHEQDGLVVTRLTGKTNEDQSNKKEESDWNIANSYSLFYKHIFDKKGHEISFDLNYFNLHGENSTLFFGNGEDGDSIIETNNTQPDQNTFNFKTDFTTFIGSNWNLGAGIKYKYQTMNDNYLDDFNFTEQIFAGYGTIIYKNEKYNTVFGLRIENSNSSLENKSKNQFLSFFPNLAFRYNLSKSQNLSLNYGRSINRPSIFELNPSASMIDSYTINSGNPLLVPEIRSSIHLDYSIQFNGNFFSSRFYYNKISDAKSSLIFINDTGLFEINRQNLGTIRQFGIQFSGTIKLGIFTFNPYFRLYYLLTKGNELAKQHYIGNRRLSGIESGLSAILSFKKNYSLSFIFQYSTPRNTIQGNTFSDPLYIISFEKTFKHKFKAGVVCAIPLKKSMVYQGSQTEARDFYYEYKGKLEVPMFPVWFKLSYQFNKGKKGEKANRLPDDFESIPKKGL
jgi:hypothetical protein